MNNSTEKNAYSDGKTLSSRTLEVNVVQTLRQKRAAVQGVFGKHIAFAPGW